MENPFKKLSKPEIYVVVAGTALIAGYAEYRHHKDTGSWSPFATSNGASNPGSGDTSVSGTVTDPQTGQTYSDTAVDPITNLTYASEISQFGSVATADSEYSNQYGATTGAVDTGGGATLPGYSSNLASVGTSTISGNDVYTSNSGWAQAATAGLTDVGYDGPTVSAAIGAFLTGTPLTPAQVTIVNTAIAEYGKPPQGNISVIPEPVAGPSTTPSPTPTPTPGKTPSVPASGKLAMPGGAKGVAKSSSEIEFTWNSVPGATKYYWDVTYQSARIKQGTTGGNSATITGLSPDHTYGLHVQAQTSNPNQNSDRVYIQVKTPR